MGLTDSTAHFRTVTALLFVFSNVKGNSTVAKRCDLAAKCLMRHFNLVSEYQQLKRWCIKLPVAFNYCIAVILKDFLCWLIQKFNVICKLLSLSHWVQRLWAKKWLFIPCTFAWVCNELRKEGQGSPKWAVPHNSHFLTIK